MRVLGSTPALRARNLEKHLLWAELLTPLVTARLEGDNRELRAETLVQASLACFDIAMNTWARTDSGQTPADYLRQAFDTLSPHA